MLSPPSYLRRRSVANRSLSEPVTRLPFFRSATLAPPPQAPPAPTYRGHYRPNHSNSSPTRAVRVAGWSVGQPADGHERARRGDLHEVLARLATCVGAQSGVE